MLTGAFITEGPQDWQIFQQRDGKASFKISGRYHVEEAVLEEEQNSLESAQVFVRVLEEKTGRVVKNWVPCSMLENQEWKMEVTIPTGGLYRVETILSLDEKRAALEWSFRGDMIRHLGVGDVYVIAGQSNSAGYGRDSVYDPPELGIHLLYNNGNWDIASHPMNDSTGTIHEVNAERANSGHSPYLSFARRLKQVLNYPIGLVQCSLGGTSLGDWSTDKAEGLYANMIQTIRSQNGVKGILWYQGCSDTYDDSYKKYEENFTHLVQETRAALQCPKLPWLTVQLNRVTQKNQHSDVSWGSVREAQRQAAHHIPNVTIIPTTDLGMSDEIHNSCSVNLIIGERMAEMALYSIYGKTDRLANAPDLREAGYCPSTQKVTLIFDHVQDRLFDYSAEMPFMVEDASGENDITALEIEGDKVHLMLSRPLDGKGVVHGEWQANPSPLPVMDIVTHLPILSFYEVEIRNITEV